MEQENIILSDIEQVKYSSLPVCIKAVLDYLGDDVSYSYIMAVTGAAFRLVWNTACWNRNNVDLYHIFTECNAMYKLGARALGREFSFLGRGENTTKEEFRDFIKKHLAEGYPCVALGIITAAGNGYFVSRNWWENADIRAVMCIGPVNARATARQDIRQEILHQAVSALEGRMEYSYAGGILAYDAWRRGLLEESHFADTGYDSLFSKLLVQNDVARRLMEGRTQGAKYLLELAVKQKKRDNRPLEQAARHFQKVSAYAEEMRYLIGDGPDMDAMLWRLTDRRVREELAELILYAKAEDEAALQCLKASLQ